MKHWKADALRCIVLFRGAARSATESFVQIFQSRIVPTTNRNKQQRSRRLLIEQIWAMPVVERLPWLALLLGLLWPMPSFPSCPCSPWSSQHAQPCPARHLLATWTRARDTTVPFLTKRQRRHEAKDEHWWTMLSKKKLDKFSHEPIKFVFKWFYPVVLHLFFGISILEVSFRFGRPCGGAARSQQSIVRSTGTRPLGLQFTSVSSDQLRWHMEWSSNLDRISPKGHTDGPRLYEESTKHLNCIELHRIASYLILNMLNMLNMLNPSR